MGFGRRNDCHGRDFRRRQDVGHITRRAAVAGLITLVARVEGAQLQQPDADEQQTQKGRCSNLADLKHCRRLYRF